MDDFDPKSVLPYLELVLDRQGKKCQALTHGHKAAADAAAVSRLCSLTKTPAVMYANFVTHYRPLFYASHYHVN
jgi:hypothetical protein